MSKQRLLLHALKPINTKLKQMVRKKTPRRVRQGKGSCFLRNLLLSRAGNLISFGSWEAELEEKQSRKRPRPVRPPSL